MGIQFPIVRLSCPIDRPRRDPDGGALRAGSPPELALRIALGAPTRAVVWLVTRGTLRSLAIGVLVGALFLAWVQRFIERFAYATPAFDPAVLGVVMLLVLVVAATALVVPLRRVRRLEPQELLHPE